ncbi:uncharacterized protein [Lolium perenne]|uniref:uncharacterized protein n=1 Tax=Lolium perenne TaxID=4522 RepID=UPI003A994781
MRTAHGKMAGSQSAPPMMKAQGGSGDRSVQPIDQYGTNLGLALGSTWPQGKGCDLVLGKELQSGMDSRVEEKEGSLISTENDSQVTDPASSWVADSPVPGGPPTKVMRLGSPLRGQEEEQTGERRHGREGEEVAPRKDLLKEALADVHRCAGETLEGHPLHAKEEGRHDHGRSQERQDPGSGRGHAGVGEGTAPHRGEELGEEPGQGERQGERRRNTGSLPLAAAAVCSVLVGLWIKLPVTNTMSHLSFILHQPHLQHLHTVDRRGSQ